MVSFEKRFKELKESKNISNRDVAGVLGLSLRAVQHYDAGDRKPDYEGLVKLAEFFDVSIDYLAGKTDDPRPMNPAVREIVENQDPKDLQLTPAEVRRLTELLEDPGMNVAFRKGVLAKKVNTRRLLKTLELLAMDDDEWEKE